MFEADTEARDFVARCPEVQFWSFVECSFHAAFMQSMRRLLKRSECKLASRDHDAMIERAQVAAIRFNEFLGRECIGWRIVIPGFRMEKVVNDTIHREAVDRAFELTRAPAFQAADGHYREAWKQYSRGGPHGSSNAIRDAGKALESTAKVLVQKLNPGEATARMTGPEAVKAVFKSGVLPPSMAELRGKLSALYEQTTFPVRNDEAHGGVEATAPPASLALLVLNLTGALILFLIQAAASYQEWLDRPRELSVGAGGNAAPMPHRARGCEVDCALACARAVRRAPSATSVHVGFAACSERVHSPDLSFGAREP